MYSCPVNWFCHPWSKSNSKFFVIRKSIFKLCVSTNYKFSSHTFFEMSQVFNLAIFQSHSNRMLQRSMNLALNLGTPQTLSLCSLKIHFRNVSHNYTETLAEIGIAQVLKATQSKVALIIESEQPSPNVLLDVCSPVNPYNVAEWCFNYIDNGNSLH